MPRQQRVHIPGAMYYVSKRSTRRALMDEWDYRGFLTVLDKARRRCHVRVHAFCLESNAIHLAIQVRDVPVSRFMQCLMSEFAADVRRRRGVYVRIFELRHRQHVVSSETLLSLVRLVHAIPVGSGLVTDAGDYAWSSAGAYFGRTRYSWLTTRDTLRSLRIQSSEARVMFSRLSRENPTVDELRNLGTSLSGADIAPKYEVGTRRTSDSRSVLLPLLLVPGVNAPTLRR